jgi:ABC-type branched-subunit amino acid transport system substrate-binding protein
MVFTGCAVQTTPSVIRIGLLAPFEGRYREIGYDLLYAARLALRDAGQAHLELFPIDDGGAVESAIDRAEALRRNPLVQVVMVAGLAATDPQTLAAFGDLPVIVIGHWGVENPPDTVFVLANAESAQMWTVSGRSELIDVVENEGELIGGEILALAQFPRLREDLTGVTIITSAKFPDAAFSTRYIESDLYVDPPGLLAMLGYDATGIAAQVSMGRSREQVRQALTTLDYTGLHGTIRFNRGFWQDAPIYGYQYDRETRTLIDFP